MDNQYRPNLLGKTLLFWLVFLSIMFLYRSFPVFPLSVIAGMDESNFQHYKHGFFAYLLTGGIEYLLFRRRITDRQAFWYSRLTMALFVPWLIFLIWYIVPATAGQLPVPLEIGWANVAVFLVGICAVLLERDWETAAKSRSGRMVLWVLLLLSVALFLRFTYGPLPWADVFVEPEW